MAPTNDKVHIVVEENEYTPSKFHPMNKAQETEGFQRPGISLMTKRKPRPEASHYGSGGGSYKSNLKALNSNWSVLILWAIVSTHIQV